MQISVQIGLDWNWPTGTELGKNTDGDGERCTTTDVFKTRGQYVRVTHIGDECSKLEETMAEVIIFVKNHYLQVWIVNADEEDNLCLSDEYFDISSSSGDTATLSADLMTRLVFIPTTTQPSTVIIFHLYF